MKKEKQIALLAVITIFAFVALIGMYLHDSARMNFYINSPSEAVSSMPEEKPESEAPPPIETININTARDIDLVILPGIGEILAERIVAYREEHGSYQSVEDLLNVDGIYQSKLDDIKDYIVIE